MAINVRLKKGRGFPYVLRHSGRGDYRASWVIPLCTHYHRKASTTLACAEKEMSKRTLASFCADSELISELQHRGYTVTRGEVD